jgi:hypothetical protein
LNPTTSRLEASELIDGRLQAGRLGDRSIEVELLFKEHQWHAKQKSVFGKRFGFIWGNCLGFVFF